MTAVVAVPYHFRISFEYDALFDVGKKLSVSFLVLLLDGSNALKEESDMVEAFFRGLLGKLSVHFRPFVVFAGGGVHSLIEGDLLPAFYLNGVPTNDWLGLYPYVECLVAQAIAAVAVIALFVVGFIKQRKLKAQATVEVPAVKA